MYLHLRVHHWVVWWFVIGVICGVVALVNILSRNLTRSQEDAVLVFGVINWVLGGLVCYSLEAVRLEGPPKTTPREHFEAPHHELTEWHPASDFLQPGRRKRLLPK